MRFAVVVALAMLACAHPPPAGPRAGDGQLGAIEASADLDGKPVGHTNAAATVVIVFASWCQHCHRELDILAKLRTPNVRIVGVNYKGHEEYDHRGNAQAVRDYVGHTAPWLTVVPADDTLFQRLGQPPQVPTMFVYDRNNNLVAVYDRRERALPDADELRDLLRRLGAG
jgi:thiol-disulfide isomerase/thioredoxin